MNKKMLIEELDHLAANMRRVAGVMVENPDHPEYEELKAHAAELQGAAYLVESWMMGLMPSGEDQ